MDKLGNLNHQCTFHEFVFQGDNLQALKIRYPPFQILGSDKKDIFTEDLNFDDNKSDKRQNISPNISCLWQSYI